MTPSEIVVRSPETLADAIAVHNLLSRVFGTLPSEHEQTDAAVAWMERRARKRALSPTSTLAAYRGELCLGSYQIDERELRLGGATVRTGCIGAVATAPEHRNQGVASTLMQHAELSGRRQGLGLLLLHGIGNFYHRFGYANVADTAAHHISIEHIDTLPQPQCRVRRATGADAPALLALYDRHQGCFVRSLALQEALLTQRLPDRAPIVAVDPHGRLCGYSLPSDDVQQLLIEEGGADTLDAAAALLRYLVQAARSAGPCPDELIWSIGWRSPTYNLLADTIPLRSVGISIPNAEWMARVASLPALFDALLPAWQWSAELHPEALCWRIGDEIVEIHRQGGELRRSTASGRAPIIQMDQTVFTRLLLGYRSVAWAALQSGSNIPPAYAPLIEALVASHMLFVPKSDEF